MRVDFDGLFITMNGCVTLRTSIFCAYTCPYLIFGGVTWIAYVTWLMIFYYEEVWVIKEHLEHYINTKKWLIEDANIRCRNHNLSTALNNAQLPQKADVEIIILKISLVLLVVAYFPCCRKTSWFKIGIA